MSMQNYANTGFTLPVKEIFPYLNPDTRKSCEQLLNDGNTESLADLLSEQWPIGFPQFLEVYLVKDEDESEDLQRGETYLCWDKSDLFKLVPTDALLNMKKKGVAPTESKWVTFG